MPRQPGFVRITRLLFGTMLALASPALASPALTSPALASPAVFAQTSSPAVPQKVAACGGFLEGPSVDSAGTLWVVDYLTGDILRVADGVCRPVASTKGAANGSRFGPDGRLYIADAKRGLLVFDPRSATVESWIDRIDGSPMIGANDLVFDEAGNLYVTVRGDSTYLDPAGQVIVIPRGSNVPHVLARGLRFPNGIAIDAAGTRLFVGLFSEKMILAINLDPKTHMPGLSYVFVRTHGGIGPDGMSLDAKGRLYWADFGGGTISVADAEGCSLGRIRLPASAGVRVTNMAWHGADLYITEAARGDIWRVTPDIPLIAADCAPPSDAADSQGALSPALSPALPPAAPQVLAR